jgi:hypothetical protein
MKNINALRPHLSLVLAAWWGVAVRAAIIFSDASCFALSLHHLLKRE